MKILRASFFILLTLSIFSCSKDDDCVQSDWVGTYTGTINCDGVEDDVTVTITADGSEDIVVQYETESFFTEYEALTPDGCSLSFSATQAGISGSVDLELDGDDLSISESFTFGTETTLCDLDVTKN